MSRLLKRPHVRRVLITGAAATALAAGLTWFGLTGERASLTIGATSFVAFLGCAVPCSIPLVGGWLWSRRRPTNSNPPDQ